MYDKALWRREAVPRRRTTSTSSPASTRTSPRPRCGARQQVNLFPGATVDGVFAHLVRQGPGRRPLDGRAQARQRRRHLAAWRRARAGRRRPWLPVLDPAAPERAGVRRGDDPGRQSRRRCRSISTSACWASRCRATRAAGSASRRSPRRSRVGASVWVDPERIQIVMPTDFELPPGGLGIRRPDRAARAGDAPARTEDGTRCAPSCAPTASTAS